MNDRKVLTRHVLFPTLIFCAISFSTLNIQFFCSSSSFFFCNDMIFSRNVYYFGKTPLFLDYVLQFHDEYLSSFNWTMFGKCSFDFGGGGGIYKYGKREKLPTVKIGCECDAMRWMYIMNLIKFPHRQSRLSYIFCV